MADQLEEPTDHLQGVEAFRVLVISEAGCTAGPPVIGGRTADCCSVSGSWACNASASMLTMTLSFRKRGLSEMRCMLSGWLSTATAEMRGPVSDSLSALIAAVQ